MQRQELVTPDCSLSRSLPISNQKLARILYNKMININQAVQVKKELNTILTPRDMHVWIK